MDNKLTDILGKALDISSFSSAISRCALGSNKAFMRVSNRYFLAHCVKSKIFKTHGLFTLNFSLISVNFNICLTIPVKAMELKSA